MTFCIIYSSCVPPQLSATNYWQERGEVTLPLLPRWIQKNNIYRQSLLAVVKTTGNKWYSFTSHCYASQHNTVCCFGNIQFSNLLNLYHHTDTQPYVSCSNVLWDLYLNGVILQLTNHLIFIVFRLRRLYHSSRGRVQAVHASFTGCSSEWDMHACWSGGGGRRSARWGNKNLGSSSI